MTHLPQVVQVSEVAPRLVEVGDNAGFAAAAGDVLGARALDVPADAHAPAAKDAAVVVHAEERDACHPPPISGSNNRSARGPCPGCRPGLQLAMAVGDADGADVVALGEQQFQRHAAVFAQPFAVGLDRPCPR